MTRPLAHHTIRLDVLLNPPIAGAAAIYMILVIALFVAARTASDYPHALTAFLTDWVARKTRAMQRAKVRTLTHRSTIRCSRSFANTLPARHDADRHAIAQRRGTQSETGDSTRR